MRKCKVDTENGFVLLPAKDGKYTGTELAWVCTSILINAADTQAAWEKALEDSAQSDGFSLEAYDEKTGADGAQELAEFDQLADLLELVDITEHSYELFTAMHGDIAAIGFQANGITALGPLNEDFFEFFGECKQQAEEEAYDADDITLLRTVLCNLAQKEGGLVRMPTVIAQVVFPQGGRTPVREFEDLHVAQAKAASLN